MTHFKDGELLAVVTPERYPAHLRGVFLTRSREVANQRALSMPGAVIFRPIDMDEMTARQKAAAEKK